MLVPQPGDQPALVGVDLREPRWPGQVVVDVADPAGLDQHVDGPGPARPVPQLDDPRAPEQEVHARNVGVLSTAGVGATSADAGARRCWAPHSGEER